VTFDGALIALPLATIIKYVTTCYHIPTDGEIPFVDNDTQQ
jgi:hypothetical protein